MKKLSFTIRINLGFVIVFAIMLVTTLYSIWNLNAVNNKMMLVYEHPFKVSNAIREIQIEIYKSARLVRDIRLVDNKKQLDSLFTEINECDAIINKSHKLIYGQYLGNKADVVNIYIALNEWKDVKNKMYRFKIENNADSLNHLTKFENHRCVDNIISRTKIISDFAANKVETIMQQTTKQKDHTFIIVIITLCIVSLAVFLISYFITKSINKPIRKFIREANSIFSLHNDKYDSEYQKEEELFNFTLKEIKQSYQNIEQQNEEIKSNNEQLSIFNLTLEEKINERTKLLKEKTEEIEAQNEEYIQINEELRESKGKIEESEAKYHYLYENAPVGIFRTKIDGSKIEEINNTACEILGFSKEEIIEHPYVIRWADPNLRNEILKTMMNFGIATNFDADILKKDNTKISCLLSMKIYEENGLIEGFITDITERKKTKDLLKEKNEEIEAQNEEYKQINEELHEAKELAEENEIFLTNVQKIGLIGSYKTDFVTGFWDSSETLNEIFGIDKDYIKSINGWLNIVHPEEAKNLNDYLNDEVIEKKQKFNKEYKIKRISDGEIRWVHGLGNVEFDENGTILSMIGTIQDITERKNNEIALKEKNEKIEAQNEEYKQINEELRTAKEKAEESERLKSAFLSNMSHEIRTPLNKIIGYSGLLTEEKLSKTDRTEFISQVNINSTRLLNLITDILDLSKIEAGQVATEPKDFDINKLIDELFDQHKKTAEQKQLLLCSHKESESESLIIKSSENSIYQILNNLINNAIKYSETGTVDYGYKIRDKEIELFVSDTGIGISPEYVSKMFNRFSQENPFSNRSYEGAGLGLSIVKAIVDVLNGEISITSSKGKGTTFNVLIPFEKIADNNNPQQSESPQGEIKGDKSITLLIVEDDAASFHLLKLQISRTFTCKIIHAINGLKAIEAIKTYPEITCVLMDMNLPGMDGCEATKKIKEINNQLPVFALTAASMDREKEKAISSGCNEFFSKPVDLEMLFNMILKYRD